MPRPANLAKEVREINSFMLCVMRMYASFGKSNLLLKMYCKEDRILSGEKI